MTFRPKPTSRPSASDLATVLAPAARPLPATTGEREAATVMVNCRVTPTFARLLGRLADEAGSMHRLLAQWAAAAGHDVPEADLNPPKTGKRAVG